MKPQNVKPGNFKVHSIIYSERSSSGNFSIAKGEWQDDNTIRYAMRWDGVLSNPNDKGYPKVFNHPMWFQLPADLTNIMKKLNEII